jgi:hypothetical protein
MANFVNPFNSAGTNSSSTNSSSVGNFVNPFGTATDVSNYVNQRNAQDSANAAQSNTINSLNDINQGKSNLSYADKISTVNNAFKTGNIQKDVQLKLIHNIVMADSAQQNQTAENNLPWYQKIDNVVNDSIVGGINQIKNTGTNIYNLDKTSIDQNVQSQIQEMVNNGNQRLANDVASGKVSQAQAQQIRQSGMNLVNQASKNANSSLKISNAIDPVKAGGDAAGTFLNFATFGGSSVVLKAFGFFAKPILEKLGIQGATDAAAQVLNQGSQSAIKVAATNVVTRLGLNSGAGFVSNVAKNAALGAGYGLAGTASQLGSNATPNDYGQGALKSAASGAIFTAGSHLIGSGIKGIASKIKGSPIESQPSIKSQFIQNLKQINGETSIADLSKKATNSFENNTSGIKSNAVENAKIQINNGTAQPIKIRTTPEGSIVIEDGRHRLQAAKELGMTSYPTEDITSTYNNKLKSTTPQAKVLTGRASEAGSINLDAVSQSVKDAKSAVDAHIAQSQKATEYSGNIAKDASIHDNTSSLRLTDSAKLLNKLKGVTKEDKQAVYNYREAKAAGTELPVLTDNQKALHQIITHLTEDTNKSKLALTTLKAPGYSKSKIFNAESGNHRIALGKGSGVEKFLRGETNTPISARSLRTSTSSSKARVFYSVTDEQGNRSVAAIKNVSVKQGIGSVSKGKLVNSIDNTGKSTQLGKITPTELKNGSFKGKDGQTYKVGQATTNEITQATGQKYLKDPLVNAVIDNHETKNALEAARMINKWKTSPGFEDVALKIGEGNSPKGWTTTKLPQMQGYFFEPKVAEVLDDIYGSIKDKVQAVSFINHAFRNMMVAVPLRHNLNEIGFYFSDRGLTSLVNPVAWKRGTASIIQATNEVMNQGKIYRDVVSTGFKFMDVNDKAFADAVTKQTKSMLFDEQNHAEKIAADIGSKVTSMRQAWSAVQHKGVWLQQDILNLARIIERTHNGETLAHAANRTAMFNPQYKVPSRIAGSRAASVLLRNNNILFFGSYHYDQWKTLINVARDLAGRNGGKAAFEAVDKLAALTLGVYMTHALIDKGLQAFSGNPNANTKPFGILDLPDQLYQLATGKKDLGSVISSQIFPSSMVSATIQLFYNRDTFKGTRIYNPQDSLANITAAMGKWALTQLPTTSQIKNATSTKSILGAVLSIAGAKFPTNSPETNKLNALKYDALPNVQRDAYTQAQSGDIKGAEKTVAQYDQLVLTQAKAVLTQAGKPIPSDSALIKDLLKSGYYFAPKAQTIFKWSKTTPTSIVDKLK